METLKITVRLAASQMLPFELDVKTVFGWQVDDVLSTDNPEDKTLIFALDIETAEDCGQCATFLRRLQQKQAEGMIKEFAPQELPAELEELCSDEERLSPEEEIERAYDALAHVEREWLARELGDDHLFVIQDALQEYMEKRSVQVRTQPLPLEEIRAFVAQKEYVSGVVPVPIGDIIDGDHEWLLDELSRLLTGSELLMDITFRVAGHDGDTVFFSVTGDGSLIAPAEEPE